jgi:hypothetical protein
MSDRIFEQCRDDMIELEKTAEAEAQVKEDMEKAIDSRIASLTEEATLETLANITKTLCDELVAEGFEREAVVAYLTAQTSCLSEERQEVILKAMEVVDEQILGHTVKNEDSEEVKIKKLTEEVSQIVMSKMQVMKDEGKSAAEIMDSMQAFLEAKVEEKEEVNEEDEAEEKPAKLDVSKDVKGLMDAAKKALDAGDYTTAADAISKLATIKDIVPDEELPDFPEDEVEPEPAEEPVVEEPVEDEPIESVESEVKDDVIEEEVVEEDVVDEEKIDEVKALKDMNDGELEALLTRLTNFNKAIPTDLDMKNSMDKVAAEIKKREGEKKD